MVHCDCQSPASESVVQVGIGVGNGHKSVVQLFVLGEEFSLKSHNNVCLPLVDHP